MSNQNIVKNLHELCDRFEKNEVSLEGLQSGIEAHGSALEGLGADWENIMNDVDGMIEIQIYIGNPKNNHNIGLESIKALQKYFKW